MNIETLVANATATGKESQHVALAASLFPELADLNVRTLCVWCAEKADAPKAFRLPRGGECESCGYAGHDCLVVSL